MWRYRAVVESVERKARIPKLVVVVAPEELEATRLVVLREALVAEHAER